MKQILYLIIFSIEFRFLNRDTVRPSKNIDISLNFSLLLFYFSSHMEQVIYLHNLITFF